MATLVRFASLRLHSRVLATAPTSGRMRPVAAPTRGGRAGSEGPSHGGRTRRLFGSAPRYAPSTAGQNSSKPLAAAAVAVAAVAAATLAFWPPDAPVVPAAPLPEEDAVVTFAPEVPPPITRRHPVRLRVWLNVRVLEKSIDERHKFECWTFDGQVPGPFIRARVGDEMDVALSNSDASGMQHNVDFHAVHGPGGGTPLLTADGGETKRALFKLTSPGLFIYHCAVAPVGMHIGTGMFGLLLVEPEDGLPPAQREFYVVQSEIYTEDEGTDGVLPFSMERGLAEQPTYVVFNGRVGALTDDGTLSGITTEDTVRIYFGNAGPNLVSSFHVIGGIFKRVWREGSLLNPPALGIQTTLVPAGGASVVDLELPVPGEYTLVDHSIWRTEKGAVGFMRVDGPPRPDLYHSEEPPRLCVGCRIHSRLPELASNTDS